VAGRLDALDDPDYPAYTTGRAAEVLGVRQAFLRSLDAAGAVRPAQSAGGRRRYSRRQLAFAARIRELLDQGHTENRDPSVKPAPFGKRLEHPEWPALPA
jgi:MerR HTH family regulatory protein